MALDLPMPHLIGGNFNGNTLNNGAGIENAIVPGRAYLEGIANATYI